MKCRIGGSSPGTVLFAKFRETYIVLFLRLWPVSPRSTEGAILTKCIKFTISSGPLF